MNKYIKILSLTLVLSFAFVACSQDADCKEGDKKECCAKKEKDENEAVEAEMPAEEMETSEEHGHDHSHDGDHGHEH